MPGGGEQIFASNINENTGTCSKYLVGEMSV